MAVPNYLKEIPNEGGYVLAAPEFIAFAKESGPWKIDTRRNEILQTAKDFFLWYIEYADDLLKGKDYKMEGVVASIFRLDFKKPAHTIEFLRKSIYVSRQYVGHIRNRISDTNIHRYQHTLVGLRIDLEHLILEYEVFVRKSIDRGLKKSGRRKDLDTMDLWSAMRAMFWIEDLDGVEQLYLRDVKPVVIFQIRQLIEIYGKNLLGYFEIRNSNGTVNKRVTQEAWKFITEEVKSRDSRISLPFSVDMVNQVSDWANSFVHTTYLYSSYIQFYALEVVALLFKAPDAHIKIYNGSLSRKGGNAAIELREYYSLRVDFEKYLKEKLHAEVVVEWLDVSRVGAYVVSLGAPVPKKVNWFRRRALRVRRWLSAILTR